MRVERLCQLAQKTTLSPTSLPSLEEATTKLLAQIKHHALMGDEIDAVMLPIQNLEEVESLVRDADTLFNSGIPDEAELLLIGVCILSTDGSPAVARLATLYESRSQYSQTIQFMRHLLACKGLVSEACYQLAFALYMTGHPDEALEHLLPYYIREPTRRVTRLCGLLLKSLGRVADAVDVLASTIEAHPDDNHSIVALSQIYVEAGMYQKGLDILHMIPHDKLDISHKLQEAVIYRFMGDLGESIRILDQIIDSGDSAHEAMWPQCFNYSIAGPEYSRILPSLSRRYWESMSFINPDSATRKSETTNNQQTRIGFLTSDIGEHVVSRFLTPLLRSHDRANYFIALFSTARRFEEKALQVISHADHAESLEGLDPEEANLRILNMSLDVLVDTNGFTKNSGLPILSRRCATLQCHYIGYHATTGLRSIDYFLGDSITTPHSFQDQYTERLVQIPNLWMAYDPEVFFPRAVSKSKRDAPVLGSFSQITKINELTLQYWSAAMRAAEETILVLKDRGTLCDRSRKRIETTLQEYGVEPHRVYFFGPVESHLDHLDAYNAIDIALDTTPWSSATTAFEALGMGVPLVPICGDTTSSRMSTSVVSAAGMGNLVATTKEEFADIISSLANEYKQLRSNKAALQQKIRSSILFDEQRICRDFYATIDNLVRNHDRISASQT